MKRGIVACIGFWGSLAGSIAAPQTAFGQAPADATVTVHKGQCTTFKVGEKEYVCEKVLHNYYPKTGRQSFIFDIPDGLLGMSGIRTKLIPPSGYTLLVDAVTVLQDDGKDTKKHSGGGICTGTLSEDQRKLGIIHCEAQFKSEKVSVEFAGNGEAGTILKSEGILHGVEAFNAGYKSFGMLGIIRSLKGCYGKLKYGGDIEPLAYCFAIDYTASNVDEAMSKLVAVDQNAYTRRAKMMERANNSLKKFGYDGDGRERQISEWKSKVEQWLNERK